MKSILPIFISVFVFALAEPTRAGGFINGNGGHLVECPGEKGEIFDQGRTLLDLYEGVSWHHLTYHRLRSLRGLPFETAFSKALDMFFSGVDGRIFKAKYRDWFNRRGREIERRSSLPLWRGSFSWRTLGRNCTVRQALIQFIPTIPLNSPPPRLVVNSTYWDESSPTALPSDLKVALLVHEYVFRHLFIGGQTCALRNVREMTALLLADRSPDAPAGWDILDRTPMRCEPSEFP